MAALIRVKCNFLEAGAQTVIATSQAIRDHKASAFATKFYQSLATGASSGEAFETKAELSKEEASEYYNSDTLSEIGTPEVMAHAEFLEAVRQRAGQSLATLGGHWATNSFSPTHLPQPVPSSTPCAWVKKW